MVTITVSVNEPSMIAWLNNQNNKAEIMRLALIEYKQRHFDKIFLSREEFESALNIETKKLNEAIESIRLMKEAVMSSSKQTKQEKKETRDEELLNELSDA